MIMNKYHTKKYEKIINDVNAIYSYILSASEIKKLSNDIIRMIKVRSVNNVSKIKETDIVLITYADTLIQKNKKSFNVLNEFLKTFLKNYINIVHILPFYPSSSDDGFAIIDFFKTDNKYGNWNDIKKISKSEKFVAILTP